MTRELWTEVDRYIAERVLTPDPVLDSALRASADAGLPPIAVSPPQGKLLHLLARMRGARTILELGTLGAYSTIWLARALPPDGRLITIEANPAYAAVARENIARARLSDMVELRVGPALELSRPGTLIITDNVIRAGALIDPACTDPRVEGMRRFHELLRAEPRVSATTIQTVGSKGYDGFTVALVADGG